MPENVKDPLGNVIDISDEVSGMGNHPFKHDLPMSAIVETICNPDYIYGHCTFPERVHYVRNNYNSYPDRQPRQPKDNMCLCAVNYNGIDRGHVVTAYYTDYLSKTVNVDDTHYKK